MWLGSNLLAVFGILSLLFSKGSALYCYYCNDFETGLLNCSDPFIFHNAGVKIQLCPPGFKACYKYVITHLGHTFHARSCYSGTVRGCYKRGNVTIGQVLECFCGGDFCNSAIKIHQEDIVSFLTKLLFVLNMLLM